jgi:single-strand DNA-binding protein
MNVNNVVSLQGRISSDLTLKGVEGKESLFVNLAVQRFYNGKTDTDFLSCRAFGATAAFIAKYFTKGEAI